MNCAKKNSIKIVSVVCAAVLLILAAVLLAVRESGKGSRENMPGTIAIRSVSTDDFDMEYFTFGTGETPLVILPGASVRSVMLSADAVAAAYDCFAEDYTVYLFDTRKDMPSGFSVRDMADDTEKAMEILGIRDACVFGCSLGGMIAQEMAIYYPDSVSRLVLASTLARHNDFSRSVCGNWLQMARVGDVRALNHSVFSSIYGEDYYVQYSEAFAEAENAGTETEIRRFAGLMEAILSFDAYDEIDRIACPTLVIGSWDDRALSGESSAEIAEKLGCALYMYSGYGHAVYDEAPDYKARLLAFFTN